MSDRFAILDSSNSITYNEDLPVLVQGANLLQDSQTGRLFAQLKLQSISPKQISSVGVEIETLDTQNRIVETCNYVYGNLHLYRDNTTGDSVLVPLEDNRGRRIRVNVCSVIDSNGQEVTSTNKDIKSFWPQGTLLESLGGDKEMLKQYQLMYGTAHTFAPSKPPGLWTCSCGAINSDGEDICHKCGFLKEEILNPNLTQLREATDQRLIQEKLDRDTKKAKAAKLSIIVGTIIAAIAIISIVSTKIIIPETKYRDALKAYKAGDYNEAYSVFSSLSDYKKSRDYTYSSKKAYCEKAYKNILAGNDLAGLQEYYNGSDIKASDTLFCLAFIDGDDIPELIINKGEDAFFFTISDQGTYLDGPSLCRAIALGNTENGFYEKTGYIHTAYKYDDEAYYQWMPLRQEDTYLNSYFLDVTYYDYFGDSFDYRIESGEDDTRYVYEDEFYQELNSSTENKEMTPYKMHKNDEESREKFIVL